MSVTSQNNRYSYTGNGVTTAFAFSSRFGASSDLKVIKKTIATGAETVLTETTHYTVSGVANATGGYSSGTVTLLSAPSSSYDIIIYADPDDEQEFSLEENDDIPEDTLIFTFDKIVMLYRRAKDLLSRSVRLPDGFTDTFDTKLPWDMAENGAGKVLCVNDDGDGFLPMDDAPTVDDITTASASATAAASSATAAASSATSASSSATSAASSATAAASSATAAAASAASFHGIPSAGSAGQALLKNSGTDYDVAWGAAGVTDHGALTGLSDDDHTVYALLAGRSGGQTVTGGTGASDQLVLRSTSNGTKGAVKIADQTGETTRVGPTGSAATFNNTHEFLITGGSSSATDGLVVRRNDQGAFHAGSGTGNAAGVALLPRGPSGSPEIRFSSTGGDQDCYIRLYDTGFGNLYGYFGIGSTFKFMNSNATLVPLWISGTTGQSAPLTKWSNQNDGSNFVAQVAADGHFQGPNGSASVPAFGFMNDTNTGIYGDGSDALKIATGGTDRVTISSAGAVRLHNYGAGTLVSDASGNITASSSGTTLDIKTKTADYTLTNSEDVVICNPSSPMTITLHAASAATKKRFTIKNTGTASVTIATAGGDTIDGDTSVVIPPSSAPFVSMDLIPDGGTAWYLL